MRYQISTRETKHKYGMGVTMVRLFTLLVVAGFCYVQNLGATIYNVPVEYGTIQEGIFAASPGDTVLVQPGTYVENISFMGNNIVVGSMFLITGNTMYISRTIIDGNQSNSVVRFESMETSSARLSGFTITNGSNLLGGGGIFCFAFSSPTLDNLHITGNIGSGGGGIMCFGYANPHISNVTISQNTGTIYGGGLYCEFLAVPTLDNVTIRDNVSYQDGGGIYLLDSCHAVLNNVLIENNSAERNGGGIGCESGSNVMLDDVELVGNAAGYYGGGLYTAESNPRVMNSTVRNNTADAGGGLYTNESNPYITNSKIQNNKAEAGGGLFSLFSPNPQLIDVLIERNRAYTDGGGIALMESDITLESVTLRYNAANMNGGGIFCANATPDFHATNRNNLYLNFAGRNGNDLFALNPEMTIVILDTFTLSDFPTEYQVYPFADFAFNVLNGKVQRTASDLYVSPSGSNKNNGLTANSPLRTLSVALTKAMSNSQNPPTIHVGGGNYSATSNGEIFPLNMKEFVSICGDTDSVAVLDAASESGVLVFDQDNGVYLQNLVLTGGSAPEGGGVFCKNSDPFFERLTIHGNTAEMGGGIYSSDNSAPYVLNSTITGNNVTNGGALYCQNDKLTVVNSIFWNNFPQEIYVDNASDSSMIRIAYSDIQGGEDNIVLSPATDMYWLDGNIDVDPLFVNSSLQDFRLQELSPCLNSGAQDLSIEYQNGNYSLVIPPLDFSGNAPDIGAWEYPEQLVNSLADLSELPSQFELHQNYPNPFNPQTRIRFSLPATDNVTIIVYNSLGQQVETVLNEKMPAGVHGVEFDGSNYASGVYFYQIQTSTKNKVRKMILLK